jgi:hypothetical protein
VFPVSVSLGVWREGNGKGQSELVAARVAVDLAALGEFTQSGTEGGGAHAAALTQLVNRDGLLKLSQRLADAVDRSEGDEGGGATRFHHGQGQGWAGADQLDRDLILRRGGAMFGGEGESCAVAAEVEVGVTPAVEFAGTAEGLTGAGGVGVFAGMVHQQDGQMKLALELA